MAEGISNAFPLPGVAPRASIDPALIARSPGTLVYTAPYGKKAEIWIRRDAGVAARPFTVEGSGVTMTFTPGSAQGGGHNCE